MSDRKEFRIDLQFSVDDLYTINTGHLLICKEMFDETQRALERGEEIPGHAEMKERTTKLNMAVMKINQLRVLIDYVNEAMGALADDAKAIDAIGDAGLDLIATMKSLSDQFFDIYDNFIDDITDIQERANGVQDGFEKTMDDMLGDFGIIIKKDKDGKEESD